MENKIQYDRYFSHVKNLKQVLLVTTGRTGSDFFQSLLDGHKEILQITGIFFFHKFWEDAVCKENLNDLINEFIWHTQHSIHIAKFKSKYNKLERWDQLGENKNEDFELDTEKFIIHMKNLMQDKKINSINFFLCVHISYALLMEQDIFKTKILFYHLHHIEELKRFYLDFKKFDVICTIRDPRNTIVSGIENHKNYNFLTFNSRSNANVYFRVFQESEPILKFSKQVYTIKLEDLHKYPKVVLGQFCKRYNLLLEDSLFISTYHGKQWWGDKISEKYLNGFNVNIDKKKWQRNFFVYENLIFEFLLFKRLSAYNYKIDSKFNSIVFAPFVFFLIILPLKYEILALYLNLKNKTQKNKIKLVIFALFAYLKRISLYFNYFFKRLCNKVYTSKHLYDLKLDLED